jgi:hypothetical protein
MKRIYIAGKLNDTDAVKYLYNVHKMMHVAELVKKAGFSVYVPAIDLLMGIKFGYTDYNNYFDGSQPWLEVSDAVFLVPGWETSPGTAKEMRRAEKNHIPVFGSIMEMSEHFRTNLGLAWRSHTELIKEYYEPEEAAKG